MKLEKLTIKNYRCYKDETIFKVDDLNCLIGKNDAGKSTIMEALDAFFNDNIDAGDLSTNSDGTDIEITCEFSGIPDTLILDTSINTSPEEEGILNEVGNLEIVRVFKVGKTVGKSVFLNAYNYTHPELSNLLELKNGTLKAKAVELDVDLTGVTKTKNPPIRIAFRNHFGREKANSRIKVEGSLTTENNLKDVWGKLKAMLPIYSLFKVDKSLDDKDGDVQDPMKSAVEETLAIDAIQVKLQEIEDMVREQSTAVADNIIKKLTEIDASLAETLKSDLRKQPNWKGLFDLTLFNDEGIPLNKRGSGVRRLVLLSFFQAQAEKRKAEKNAPAIIYAIEEPETSQHPNHQMLLIQSLIELSESENTQVFFTSHSANLVKEIPIQSLRYVVKDEDNLTIQNAWNFETEEEIQETIDAVIKTLGILPNPKDSIRVLVYVEGNNDVLALKRYSAIYVNEGEGTINLSDESIGWVITGGSSLKHYVENSYLSGLGKPEVHIYDGDEASYIQAVAEINGKDNPTKVGFNTSRRELENYLHHDAINEAYTANGTQCELTIIDVQDDVPTLVADHTFTLSGGNWAVLDVIKQKEKSDKKKKLLNTQAVEQMTIARLKENAGYDEIKSWLIQIEASSKL
ncbi:MAG: ATP-binding protein [Aequorivita sp.]|nr:ATP-binding protein [Aequorivita sp.]